MTLGERDELLDHIGLSLIQRASNQSMMTALKSEFCACISYHCFQPMACGSLLAQQIANCLFIVVVVVIMCRKRHICQFEIFSLGFAKHGLLMTNGNLSHHQQVRLASEMPQRP